LQPTDHFVVRRGNGEFDVALVYTRSVYLPEAAERVLGDELVAAATLASGQNAERAELAASLADSDGNATRALDAAAAAETARDEILGLSASAITLSPGSPATADYDPGTGVLALGLPEGIQGLQGLLGPSGPGVATGGTTGQMLAKSSGTNFDTIWVAVPTGNANHTGDVTGATELTIAANAVGNDKMADVPTATIKGRATAATGDPEDLTPSQARDVIGAATAAQGALAEAISEMLCGVIGYCAMNAVPLGALKANGAMVSRTAYARLFAKIGTTYGAGNGSTTFALPDERGEFMRGWDDGRSVDAGRVFGSAQGDAIRNISGQLIFGTQMANVQSTSGAFSSGTTNQLMPQQAAVNALGIGVLNFNASNSVPTAAENRPRNNARLAVIFY